MSPEKPRSTGPLREPSPATLKDVMSVATARIAYDGDLVRAGVMDIRDLAPALLEVAALFERANNILNGEQAKIRVNVRADFKAGSFAIDLEAVQTVIQAAKAMLFGQHAQDAKYIIEWLLLGGSATSYTVVKLYKLLRGRRAEIVESPPSMPGTVIINITQTSSIEVHQTIVHLYNDDIIRQRIAGALRPLDRPGIDEFQVREGEGPEPPVVDRITKEEALEAAENLRAEDREPAEPPVLDSTYDAALQIVKIPFRDNLIWNFAQGKTRISAEMKDQTFLQRHREALVPFLTGDILLVRLRTRSWKQPNGDLRVLHEVIEVKDHIHQKPQLTLDLERTPR
jgi:hypothetical protein